jgi:ribonuclease III
MVSPTSHSATTSRAPISIDPADPQPPALEELEDALAHRFGERMLLALAVTHRSLAYEHAGADRAVSNAVGEDNERLEFLGDAVVGLVVADSLYRRYPELPEGALTRLRGALVSRRHLAEVAQTLELGKHLRLGRGEERSGGRAKRALLANAMEAVIGALFLDGGLEPVRRLIETRVVEPGVAPLYGQLVAGEEVGDFKSALQELLQSRKQGQPEYRTTAETGPDHRKRFFVEARAQGTVLSEGSGPTRKIAEQDAARRALEVLRGTGDRP